MVTESSEGNETLNTAVITTGLLFRLSRCRLYLLSVNVKNASLGSVFFAVKFLRLLG